MFALGNLGVLFSIFLFYGLESVGKLGTDTWLSNWSTTSTSEEGKGSHSVNYYLTIYFSLGMALCSFVLIRSCLVYFRSVVAAKTLHEKMLYRGTCSIYYEQQLTFLIVIQAPVSFFDTTPIGRILNRFSKDTQTIDEELPESMGELVINSCNVILVLVVVATVTPLFLAVLVPLCKILIFFFILITTTAALYKVIQEYYIQSSRELKRLDSITRSPIFAQLSGNWKL